MKLLLLLLTVSLSQLISAQMGEVGTYKEVPQSEFENDILIQKALYTGAYEVVQQGIDAGRLPRSPPFKITKINSVEEQVVAGLNYRFHVELSNGEMTLSASYVVYQKAGTGELSVNSPSFSITSASNRLSLLTEPSNDGEGVPGGWQTVDVSALNTESNLRDILSFGVQNVIVQGIEDKNLADAEYYIEDVASIEQQVVNGLNYRFNITLGDDEGSEITISFKVNEKSETGERDFVGYENIRAEVEEEQGDLVGDWHSVDVSDLDTDQYLREVFKYGLQNVINQGIENGLLSNTSYKVEEIYSIKTQVVEGENYRFNLRLENDADGFATVIFTVWDRPWIPARDTSYLFLDIGDSGIEETVSNDQPVALIDGGAFDD